MPESYRYAFAVTLSLSNSLSDEVCEAFVKLCKKAEYYAVVFELDSNGRKHAHAGVLYKLARQGGNVKSGTFMKNKTILEAVCGEGNSKYGLKVKDMCSDGWIANYMQKDGHITCHNLPESFEDLRYYFPDTAVVRSVCPEYERWERMYKEDGYRYPVTMESAEEFFMTHWNEKRDLKPVALKLHQKSRYETFMNFANHATSSSLVDNKRKQDEPFANYLRERLTPEDFAYASSLWLQT